MTHRLVLVLWTGYVVATAAHAFAQVPLITESVTPASVAPGGSTFSLRVNGDGFTTSSVLNWNGSPLPTHFKSVHKLTATIPASRIAKPVTATLTVSNPGAGLSNPVYFTVIAPSTTLSFNRSDYNVGESPIQAVTGDFNHDKRLDVAVLNYVNGTVSMLLGNGAGTFNVLPEQTPYPPYRMISMALGDFDGDGNDDLAVLLSNKTAAILLGNGDGTFTATAPMVISTDGHVNPAELVTGDFNGDGKLDIAVSDQQGENVFVLLGDGAGGLSQPLDTPIAAPGFNPIWMAVGDFNGDGKLDLAVSETGASYLAILFGDGSGTFSQSLIPFPPNSLPTDLVAADFNRDGKADLAVLTVDALYVFLGNGDGTFRELSPQVIQPGAAFLTAGDFNGDGKLDLATVFNTVFSVLPGKGDGTFETPQTFPAIGAGWVTFADFNNDGKMDFVTLYSDGSTASVYMQSP